MVDRKSSRTKTFSKSIFYMFCLYDFSVKSIIKKNYLPPYGPLNSILLLGSCNNALWCDSHQSTLWHLIKCTVANLPCDASTSATFTNLHCVPSASAPFTDIQCMPHQVLCSLISTVRLLQVHRSLISTVCLLQLCRTPISTVRLYKCTIHQSPVLSLYKGCTNLHCCIATVAPFYSESPFISYHLCDHATRQLCDSTLSTILLPMWICLVDYLTASLKSKFLQLYRTFCLLSMHLFYCCDSAPLTCFKSTFISNSWTPFGRLHSTCVFLHYLIFISAFFS